MRYVIIGASAAGLSAAEAIRQADTDGRITIISDEKAQLYSRCLLTYYISGRIGRDGLAFKDRDFYKVNRIDAIHGQKAAALDCGKKEVVLENKKTVKFDRLLIATGASPKKAGIPGEDKEGVFCLRAVGDADAIIGMCGRAETAVILGGGLIGLRDAYALRLRGKKVRVIVRSSQILSQMCDREAAGIIEAKLASEGIVINKGLSAREITGGKEAGGILLDDGSSAACELIIVGKGVQPNTGITAGTGIKVETGILTDEHMRTCVDGIYAAGDVAQARDLARQAPRINAIWPAAVEQGRIAGLNMAGRETAYDGSVMMNATDFYGLAAITMGITRPEGAGFQELKSIDRKRRSYKKVVLRDNRLCGLIAVNSVKNAGVYGALIRSRVDISAVKERLLDTGFDYAAVLPIIKDNPDKFRAEEFSDTTLTY